MIIYYNPIFIIMSSFTKKGDIRRYLLLFLLIIYDGLYSFQEEHEYVVTPKETVISSV